MGVEEILILWISMCTALGLLLFIEGVKDRKKKK